jgi:hypothetical protein
MRVVPGTTGRETDSSARAEGTTLVFTTTRANKTIRAKEEK